MVHSQAQVEFTAFLMDSPDVCQCLFEAEAEMLHAGTLTNSSRVHCVPHSSPDVSQGYSQVTQGQGSLGGGFNSGELQDS